MRPWKALKIWPDADVVIIGGGPSFNKVDQSVLKRMSIKGKIRVIGINKAYKHIPDSAEWMHVIFFGDDVFYKRFLDQKNVSIYEFPGLRVCGGGTIHDDPAVKFMLRDKAQKWGITTKRIKLCWNKNSGGGAINLAYHFTGPGGRLFLFGYDNKMTGGETHWHGGYTEIKPKLKTGQPYNKWAVTFDAVARDAEKLGLQIFNVNPDSALDCFDKITFDEFQRMIKDKDHGKALAN